MWGIFQNPHKTTQIHTKPGEGRPIPRGEKAVNWPIGATRTDTNRYEQIPAAHGYSFRQTRQTTRTDERLGRKAYSY